MRRIVQFFLRLARRRGLRPQDKAWIDEHLCPAEKALLERTSPADQRHAVRVSKRAADIARRRGMEANALAALIRAGLLHDIGKLDGELSTVQRVLVVVGWKLFPRKAAEWSEGFPLNRSGCKGTAWLKRAFYVQRVHAARGAALAAEVGVEPAVVDLIRRHHDVPRDELERALAAADQSG